MKTKSTIVKLFAVALLLIILTKCSKKEEAPNPLGNSPTINNPTVPENNYTPPAITFSTSVSGLVEDVNGNPIQNALVSTGSTTFTTDENGAFELMTAPFTGDFCYIKAQKSGFFTASTTVHGKAGSIYTARLVMVPQDNVESFKATETKTITTQSGAKVEFPANAIKNLDGSPYTGQVSVATKHINPSDSDFPLLIPGGDLRAFSSDGNEVQLYSYGMLNVELRDDQGNLLQIADGKKATLKMPVPADMQSTAPQTIPLWYFDENKGIWIEEGEAKLQNGQYIGEVDHFTPWNYDWLGERAYIKGTLTDCEGEILTNTTIYVGQMTVQSNEKGEWRWWVPAGIEINIGHYSFQQRAFGDKIISPPILSGGQEYDMGELSIKCISMIKAQVKDCDNKPFNGYAILNNWNKDISVPITNGYLNQLIYTDYGEEIDLFFYNPTNGKLSKFELTFPEEGKIVHLGEIKACPATTVKSKFSFDYDDGSGVKTVSYDNIVEAYGTYFTAKDLLILHFKDDFTAPFIRKADIGIRSPKVGVNPSFGAGDSTLMVYVSNSELLHSKNITVILDKYEGQGGEISGTFSGQGLKYDLGWKTFPITNGKFTILRHPDR